LLEKYPNDVKLVFKHFPLSFHKFAEKSSLAALAAAKQNKFREMSDILFKNQSKLSDATILQCAQDVGLNMEQFNKDYNDPSLKKEIQQDMKLGQTVKVRGVPAIFINGRIAKNRSVEGFSQMVEEELKKGKQKK
jgi:protein-disulfide isomerase